MSSVDAADANVMHAELMILVCTRFCRHICNWVQGRDAMVLSIAIPGPGSVDLCDGPHIIMCNNVSQVPSSEYHAVINDDCFQVYAHRESVTVKRCVDGDSSGSEHVYTVFFSVELRSQPTDFNMVFLSGDLETRDDDKPLVSDSVPQIEVWGNFEENVEDCEIVLQNVSAGQFDAETVINSNGYYKTINVSNSQPLASEWCTIA